MAGELLAGGTGDFLRAHRLTATGNQVEIGRRLAREARLSYGWRPEPAEPRRARARRRWFAENWPQHHDRMRGAAEEAGLTFEDDRYHLDGLTGLPRGAGCSATFRDGVLARNFDFFTTSKAELMGLLAGQVVDSDDPPMVSRPYVLHSQPTDGPATLLITADTLDACMDGVNEHGLAVVLLIADAENTTTPVEAPPQVGLNSAQLPRFLLDTCATAEQARDALLHVKQYDYGTPLHYLVADASGDCFVWERGPGGDEHITDGDGALCVTNHLLHRHPGADGLPADTAETMLTFQRYRRLAKATAAGVPHRQALDEISFDARADSPYPIRTLWRSAFDLGTRELSVRFYLGDAEQGSRYSEEITLAC
ncbi:hypothetical protein JOF53_001661 [Crossiella equi]|uniref:Peptidase C45 hydrolase domain-containing protein n=1 Tax=Crossiella equi TaxID=130796 RepID=A0ABS5A882_9PSEU|nr:C45 family autoproteolytic acyltransferase/hydolase [Crossiella equi]MBP2472789.1 hypothetical protein [Crossiella equi]